MDEKVEFAERLKTAMLNAGYEPRPGILEKGFNTRYWGRAVTFQACIPLAQRVVDPRAGKTRCFGGMAGRGAAGAALWCRSLLCSTEKKAALG